MEDIHIDKNEFTLPNQTFIDMNLCTPFENLTAKEKFYAHYFSQASWYGSLISLVQSSPEAPLIFSLFYRIFSVQTIQGLRNSALLFATEDDFSAFLAYVCGFFANSGNYDLTYVTKFVPNLDFNIFENFVKISMAYQLDPDKLEDLWSKCKKPIFSLTNETLCLGLGENGITTFFSDNCTENDSCLVNEWLDAKRRDGFICRTFKTVVEGRSNYEIKLASVNQGEKDGVTIPAEEYKGSSFAITRGEYSPLLCLINQKLTIAKNYAANYNQVQMIDAFIESFTEGSLDRCIAASKYWFKDKSPVVESYIGFIEPYRDPTGVRGDFQGFVAISNKDITAKLKILEENAEKFIALLPWEKDYENDNYLRPNFSSLDILTFAGGIAAGITVPSYDEIHSSADYKKMLLVNVIIHNSQNFVFPFLSDEDQSLMKKYKSIAYEVQVTIHELLGHSCGKLFCVDNDGNFNFDLNTVIDPFTNQLIDSWYEPGESFLSTFGKLAISYDECRAECIGLYLSLNRNVLSAFGITDELQINDVIYVYWLSMIWSAFSVAIKLYDPINKQWQDPHCQARYAIMQVLLQADQELIDIEETENGKNLLLHVDRTKIETVGREAIQNFLLRLQVYKSTGDLYNASQLYNHYSKVSNEPFEKWRNIALAYKNPKPILVQANTFATESNVILKTYEATTEGYIESWLDRFHGINVCDILENIWDENKKYYPTLIN